MSQNADVSSRRTVTFILGSLGFLFFALAIWLFVIKPGQDAVPVAGKRVVDESRPQSPKKDPSEPLPVAGRVGYQTRYELPRGEEKRRDHFRQFGFWTPSVVTKNNIKDDSMKPGRKREWQNLRDENITVYFGEVLAGRKIHRGVNWKKDRGVVGWRRYLTYGSGSSARKDGWWWTMTVNDKFDIAQFVGLYADIYYADITGSQATGSKFVFPDDQDPQNRDKWEREDIFIEEYNW
jgi:hypothetical protein